MMIRGSAFTETAAKIHTTLFFILIALLPVQLGFHVWPSWSFVLGRRVDYLSPTLFATDAILIGMLLFWVLADYRNIFSSLKKTQTVFLCLMFVYAAGNILFAERLPVAAFAWMKVAEFMLLGFYIVRNRPDMRRVIRALAIAVLWSSLLAVVQFFLRHSVGGQLWLLGERTFSENTPGIARADLTLPLFSGSFAVFRLRPYATFPHPNVLGGFLAVTMPLLFYDAILLSGRKTTGGIPVNVLHLSIPVGLFALLLTFSRSAWIAGCIGVIAVCFIFLKKFSWSGIMASAAIFGGVLYAVVRSITPADESFTVRMALNASAWEMWKQHPWTGVGLGNFLAALPSFIPSRTIYFLQPVHNIYLLLLSEAGVAGTGVLAYCFFRIVRQTAGVNNKIHGAAGFRFACRISWILLLALGFVDHYPITLQQGQLLLTLLTAMSIVY